MFNRFVQYLLVIIFRLHARLTRSSVGKRPVPDRVRRVLFVSTTGLGDTLLSTPALNAAREAWPDAEIYAFLHKRWSRLLAACPHLSGIVVYHGKFKQVRATLRALRALEPDLALVVRGNDPDIVPLVYLAGARCIVCRDTTPFHFLVDVKVPGLDSKSIVIERLTDVVRAAAGDLAPRGLELFLPNESRDWADGFLARHGIGPADTFIVLNPGGSHQAKQWPEEHWIGLIRLLGSRPGVRLALLGSPAEKGLLDRLAGSTHEIPEVLAVGRSDVVESAALIEKASFFIGPDSGLYHVAVSLGVPVLVMFGPDDPDRTGPYLTKAPAIVLRVDPDVCPDLGQCKKKECRPNRCLAGLTPDMVLAAIDDRLPKM